MTENLNKIEEQPNWMAVYAVALGVAGLITAEFLPVSILSPMAKSLQITEGIAGQTMSITAIVAMFSSIFTGIITRKFDRRWVLLSFSILQVVSSLFVAFAPNFFLLMFGRVLLGVAVGGFWAMSLSIAMRLVPEKHVSKALSIIFSTVSVATVVSGPVASFLDGLIGWRNVFLLVAIIGGASFVWQLTTLPSLPPTTPPRLRTLSDLLKRKPVRLGILANTFSFAGYAVFFTYLRPFLENVTHLSVNPIALVLLIYGVTNLIGAIAAKTFLEKSIFFTLLMSPLAMAVSTILLIALGNNLAFAGLLVAIFGFSFGSVQVGWPTWLTKAASDEAESAGSLLVAFTQIAITIGAGIGGLLYDQLGINVTLAAGGLVLVGAVIISFIALKQFEPENVSAENIKIHV